MRLADVARIQGRYSEALQYEDAYIVYKDSAIKEEYPAKVIATLKDMFYHQSVYQYETFMSRYRLYILLLSIVLLIAISSIVWRHFTEQHKVKLSLLNQRDIQIKESALEQLLQEKRDEINLLEQSCAESEGDRIKQLQINSC